MEILARGTLLETDEISVPGAPDDAPIAIERGLGECPHGFWYEAYRDSVPLLVTILDPIVAAQPDLRAQLQRDIDHGRYVSHRNLLPCYGLAASGLRVFTVEAWPGGSTVREFSRQRRERGDPLDREDAYTLCAHVCNALTALHDQLVHAYVTVDTVHVSDEGRVLVGAMGIGRILARTRGFARFRSGGLLPNTAPEQVMAPPQVMPSTDVFGLATFFMELTTGQSLVEAGQPVRDLGIVSPPLLVECLERATQEDPGQRQPDIATFKAQLRAALRAAGVRTVTRPPGELDAAAREAMSRPPPPPAPDDNFDDWTDLAVPEDSDGIDLGSGSHPRAAPAPGPWGGDPRQAAQAAPPVPTALGPEFGGPPGAVPGYPYPPPGAPGYPYPPPAEGAAPGYPYPPPPGYPYPPPGYPYPPPPPGAAAYPYPPPGYPYPPPGYPYPPPGAPAPGYPPTAGPPGEPVPAVPPHPGVGPVPPPPPDPGSARLDLDELDRATRRIADVDAGSALLEFTENVGDGDARFGEEEVGAPEGEIKANTSMLGLEVGAYEETAQRLATIDGVEENDPTSGPTQSGTFFGNIPDESGEADSKFVVVRDGKNYGPYSIAELTDMVKTGRIRGQDTLRNDLTHEQLQVIDVPALAKAAPESSDDLHLQRAPKPVELEPPRPPARPAPVRPPQRSMLPLVIGAAVVTAGAGVAGWLVFMG